MRKLLQACPDTFEGRRNLALIALLADSGLRISEALRLRIEDANFSARTIAVRGGKGGKDSVGFFGAEAAQYIRAWLARRREVRLEDHLFVDRSERSLTRHAATHILHRLSGRAGLSRKLGPHALRHYAATSILQQTGDLRAGAPGLAPRELDDGAAVRASHKAGCQREVQKGKSSGQSAGGTLTDTGIS